MPTSLFNPPMNQNKPVMNLPPIPTNFPPMMNHPLPQIPNMGPGPGMMMPPMGMPPMNPMMGQPPFPNRKNSIFEYFILKF